jgi:hypothetical protein
MEAHVLQAGSVLPHTYWKMEHVLEVAAYVVTQNTTLFVALPAVEAKLPVMAMHVVQESHAELTVVMSAILEEELNVVILERTRFAEIIVVQTTFVMQTILAVAQIQFAVVLVVMRALLRAADMETLIIAAQLNNNVEQHVALAVKLV